MTQGSDINWASVNVKISVNNGAPIDCDRQAPGETVDTNCALIDSATTPTPTGASTTV